MYKKRKQIVEWNERDGKKDKSCREGVWRRCRERELEREEEEEEEEEEREEGKVFG